MNVCARETVQTTLTRLIKAMDSETPVTVTYTKADGSETVRTIEIHDILVTLAGDIVLKAMDRETQEMRSWRLDRIKSYTLHRGMAFTVTRDEQDNEKPQAMPSLRHPHPVLIAADETAITDPIEILALALAA